MKIWRASGLLSTSREASRSIADRRDSMRGKYTGFSARHQQLPMSAVRRGKITSIANWKSSNALTLASNQHTSHPLGSLPCFGKRGVGAVPARVVGVMSGRTSLAMVALSATGSMQNNLVRPSQPVFVDVKIDHVGERGRRSSNQSRFGSDLLYLGPGFASHGQKRQAIDLLDFAHH